MTPFEAGFYKYAQESKLSDSQAACMYKRAMDYSGTQEMFKQLPDSQSSQQGPVSSEQMEMLQQLVQQELIDKEMQAPLRQVQM